MDEETNSGVKLHNQISDVIIKSQETKPVCENWQIRVFSICHALITVHSFDISTFCTKLSTLFLLTKELVFSFFVGLIHSCS